MPCVKDVQPFVNIIANEIKAISGVLQVYAWGSYVENLTNPNYIVKDLDIIAKTKFNSSDLMSIDAHKYGAIGMKPQDLEDSGFNPEAVAFTKKFLSYNKYNVDHWCISSDKKLLHWGAIPDTQEDWRELHASAEKEAQKDSGLSRS